MRRSPGSPTSASTLSSSFGGDNTGGMAALPGVAAAHDPTGSRKHDWASDLQPIPNALDGANNRCGLDDWDTMISASSDHDHSLLRWISGDVDDSSSSSFALKHLLHNNNNNPLDFDSNSNSNAGFDPFNASSDLHTYKLSPNIPNPNQNPIFGNHFPLGMMYSDDKPQIMTQSPNLYMSSPPFTVQQEQNLLQPQAKRHNSGDAIQSVPFSESFLKPQQQHLGFPQFVPQKNKVMAPGEETGHQQQQHALLDQLYKAAELVGSENLTHAQAILARLNQQLSPVGKPLHRVAFYFKEALQLLLSSGTTAAPPPRSPTPFDVIFKMGAYKVFSEVSPLIQFVNFTSNQALLESLHHSHRIHIVDFDIGFGAQWSSFMQELPARNRGPGGAPPSLKITAFASPTTHHPVELVLMRENLNQFAQEIGLTFELQVINFDSLADSSYSLPMFMSSSNEAVAVNLPVWSSSDQPSALPALLRFVKQLSPKIVVSLDRGCDRTDLPFPQHLLHAMQSYIHLLESLDAVNVNSDALNKIERFLFQPRIESTVLGRLRAPEKMPLWKTLFASAGFSPMAFSNFTETQAECVVRRTSVRGFHVDKRQASLVLCWQRRELISASAWRC